MLKNWTAQTYLLVIGGVITIIEPKVADFVRPGWQPRVVDILVMLGAIVQLLIGVLNATTPKDRPLVQAAASGSLGPDALKLASSAAKGRASKPPPAGPLGPAATMLMLVACCVFGPGCTPGAQSVVNDVGQTALCVDNEVVKLVNAGVTTFEEITAGVVAACGQTTVATIEAIIQALTQKVGPASLLGVKLIAIHHKDPRP